MHSIYTGPLCVLGLTISAAHAAALGNGHDIPRAAGADETIYPPTTLYSPTTVVGARNANAEATSIVETLYSYSVESFPVSGATTYSYTDIALSAISTITTEVDLPSPTTSAAPRLIRGVPLQGPEGQIGPIETLMPIAARSDGFETVFVPRDEGNAPPTPANHATPASFAMPAPTSMADKLHRDDK